MAPTKTQPQSRKPDADASDAVSRPILDRLDALVIDADALVKVTKPVRTFTNALDALHKMSTSQSEDDAKVLALAIKNASTDGKDFLAGAIDALRNLDALAEILAPVGSPDRAEGDALVAAFNNLKAANNATNPMLSSAAIERGDALVTRWAASAPKSTGTGTGQRGSGPGKPPLPGYRVTYTCDLCHKVMGTSKDYLNSARDACKNHVKDHHPNVPLPSAGTSAYDAISVALMRVGNFKPDGPVARAVPESERGTFDKVPAGGFTFGRVAA